jgi:hypothetical protein
MKGKPNRLPIRVCEHVEITYEASVTYPMDGGAVKPNQQMQLELLKEG